MTQAGKGRFRAFSAGSFPKREVHPEALDLLQTIGLPTDGLYPKSWDEFARPSSPPLDFVITLCDNIVGEMCPVWSGKPITAHWGIPDPAAATVLPPEMAAAFATAAKQLRTRLDLFLALPLASIDRMSLQSNTRAIHRRANDAE